MNGGRCILASTALVLITACGTKDARLEVRSIPTPAALGQQPVPLRIAEARAQLALGNVALALESFRRAAREDTGSVEALAGMAQCYDRMGRYDLARRYYESALALAPSDLRLLGELAASLELGGKAVEANRLRGEIAARTAAAATVAEAPEVHPGGAKSLGAQPSPVVAVAVGRPSPPVTESGVEPARGPAETAAVAPPQAGSAPDPVVNVEPVPVQLSQSVTVRLPALRPAPKPLPQAVPAFSPDDAPQARTVRQNGPRLERLSLGEVALVTTGKPRWQAQPLKSTSSSATVRFVPLRPAIDQRAEVRLLNAARVHRLAARHRAMLSARGWRGIAIGDASAVRARSVVLYPAGKRLAADRLAAQFGFPTRVSNGHTITVLLGRDSVARLRT